MFSIITMASSTTSPVARTIPSRVRILMENPKIYMIKKVPIKEMGMAMTGMRVVLQFLKNRKMMMTTRVKAIITVSCTSVMAFRMGRVSSKAYPTLISGGSSLLICSTRWYISSAIAM